MANTVICHKFRRGDVWFVYNPTSAPSSDVNTYCIKKSRPFLIVSAIQGDSCGPLLTVVPLASRDEDGRPTHITYEFRNKTSTILCDQITTIDTNDFNHEGSYFMYGLPDNLMQQVDIALALHLNLTRKPVTVSAIDDCIHMLTTAKEAMLQKQAETYCKDDVAQIAEIIAKRFNIPLSVSNEQAESTSESTEDVQHATTTDLTKPKHSRWSKNKMTMFLNDYRVMSPEGLAAKYNIQKSYIAKRYQMCQESYYKSQKSE